MHHLEMHASSPTEVFMNSMNILLLISEHKPIHAGYDKIADNCHCVQKMMLGLHIDRVIWGLKRISSEVSCIVRGIDRRYQRYSGEHKSPVSKWDKEAIKVHKQIVSDVTWQYSSKHKISHSLSSVYMSRLI
mgnify:CR=1 FL=1